MQYFFVTIEAELWRDLRADETEKHEMTMERFISLHPA